MCSPEVSDFQPHEGASVSVWEVGVLDVSIFILFYFFLPETMKGFLSVCDLCLLVALTSPVCSPTRASWERAGLSAITLRRPSLPFFKLCKQSSPWVFMCFLPYKSVFLWAAQEVFVDISEPLLSLSATHGGRYLVASRGSHQFSVCVCLGVHQDAATHDEVKQGVLHCALTQSEFAVCLK